MAVRALAFAALAVAASACQSKVIEYQVNIVTSSCVAAGDPFAGAQYLTLRITGEGISPPLEANSEASSRQVKLPEIPAGLGRVVQVRVYGSDGPGGKVLSWGQSLPFDVPDVVPEVLPAGTINVFLRKVDTFTPPAAVTSPKDCAKLKVPRAGHTATLLANGKVFIAGGFRLKEGTQERIALSDTELFNPQTGAFESARAMSVNTQFLAQAFHTATLLRSGQVLIWGGEQYLGGVANTPAPRAGLLIYDPDVDLYGAIPSRVSPPNIVRSRHSAVMDKNGKVLVVGGLSRNLSNDLEAASRVEWFDPSSNTSAVVDNLSLTALEGAVAAVQGGALVAVAGGSDGGTVSREVTYFGFDGTAFKKTGTGPQLATPRRAAAVATARDGDDLLLFGGHSDAAGVAPLASTEVVATRANTVGSGPNVGARGEACVATLLDGTLLVTGGRTVDALGQPSHSDTSVTLVRPQAAGGYLPTVGNALATGRFAHTCTTLADGSVLVLGGVKETAGTQDVLQDAWIYQPPPND